MNTSALCEGAGFVGIFADEFEEDDAVEVTEFTDVASEFPPPSVCPPCLVLTFFLLKIFLMSILLLLDVLTSLLYC